MAYGRYGDWPDDIEKPFWDIHTVVVPGTKGPDVMLVQYFLQCFGLRATAPNEPVPGNDEFKRLLHTDPLHADGVFGPQTRRWMQAFEKFERRVGFPVVGDGIVRNVPPGAKKSAQTGTYDKLYMLNSVASDWSELCGDKTMYYELPLHPMTPVPLRAHLLSIPPAGA